MITLATIEEQTREYAALRRAALDQAAQIQNEIEAVRIKHEKTLRKRVKRMTDAHEALYARIETNPALFPEGAKSFVVDGIKVGYQKGKAKLDIKDEAASIRVLQSLIEDASHPDYAALLGGAIKTTQKLVDSGLKKLLPEVLSEIGVTHIPAADSVLVMPQDDDTTKAVDALIKATQTDIADGE